MKIGKNALHDYLAHIEDSFLAFLVFIRSESVRQRQVNPRKVYAVDPGLVQAFCFQDGNFGHLFENVVYLDLRRAGCDVSYHVTRSGYEVGFVAKSLEGEERIYQVCFDTGDRSTLEREERALDEARQELGFDGQLITPENYPTEFLTHILGAGHSG